MYRLPYYKTSLLDLPKISIITPSYNQGQYLEETILSIVNQGYPNLEYILIDGGSTDNSLDIIAKYKHEFAFTVSEPDNGQSDAINKGFRRSTGDIVCWLNSDDVLIPGALQEIARIFVNRQEIDIINGSLLIIDGESRITSAYYILKQRKWYAKQGIYYLSQPSMFWRRRILDLTGLLREDLHAQMDKELLIRMFELNCKIAHTNRFLAGFRKHEASKGALGVESNINVQDTILLRSLYGDTYVQRPKPLSKLLYFIHKFVRGIYLKKWLFTLIWKGKSVAEFNRLKQRA